MTFFYDFIQIFYEMIESLWHSQILKANLAVIELLVKNQNVNQELTNVKHSILWKCLTFFYEKVIKKILKVYLKL